MIRTAWIKTFFCPTLPHPPLDTPTPDTPDTAQHSDTRHCPTLRHARHRVHVGTVNKPGHSPIPGPTPRHPETSVNRHCPDTAPTLPRHRPDTARHSETPTLQGSTSSATTAQLSSYQRYTYTEYSYTALRGFIRSRDMLKGWPKSLNMLSRDRGLARRCYQSDTNFGNSQPRKHRLRLLRRVVVPGRIAALLHATPALALHHARRRRLHPEDVYVRLGLPEFSCGD